MGLLTKEKAYIDAMFSKIGIPTVCISASFDEEVFVNNGMFIQQAYFLSVKNFVKDEADTLDKLGKTLSPYSGVVSTPSP
jgi:hypothetical protein